MDAFLYRHKISLSKLVQNAITERMQQIQKTAIEKEIDAHHKRRLMEKQIATEQVKNPKFEKNLFKAKQTLEKYFNAFDIEDIPTAEHYKIQMLQQFPEMYVDVIKFEQWKKQNVHRYQEMKDTYDNVVERLIRIKNEYL